MAALLRHRAARRLGRSMFQRAEAEAEAEAEAAVAERRCRLGTRLMHTEESMNDQIKHLEEELDAEFRGHLAVEREVHQKKEELYDVIAKAEHSFWTSSFRNRRLQQLLAVQINPRPEDSEWRRLRFSRRANSLLEAAGLLALIGVVSSGSVRYRSYFEDKKAMQMEEELEARGMNDGLMEN